MIYVNINCYFAAEMDFARAAGRPQDYRCGLSLIACCMGQSVCRERRLPPSSPIAEAKFVEQGTACPDRFQFLS